MNLCGISDAPSILKGRCREVIKLCPYPDGKSFGFTIIDDTDGSSLEMIRPIYDYLTEIGLRTTKTVWVTAPKTFTRCLWDESDTLEREEYIVYLKTLQEKGFEIALHNVSGESNVRKDIIDGLEKFRRILGNYPRINVHHEKNMENLYLEIVQSSGLIPNSFRSPLFVRMYALFKKVKKFIGHNSSLGERKVESQGAIEGSNYFWGDVCKEVIKYVRTSIFYRDLNTLRCNPGMPYSLMETPYVNYWFDSSNGQDVKTFNRILNSANIRRLKEERGCSILYTHFGKGFSVVKNGQKALNEVTKERLSEIAGSPDGWYAPVTEILDRLLSFKRINYYLFPNGIVFKNENLHDIRGVTLWTRPNERYHQLDGSLFTSDKRGRIVIPLIRSGEVFILFRTRAFKQMDNLFWGDQGLADWVLDINVFAERVLKKAHLH
jgi:hypothetical protein